MGNTVGQNYKFTIFGQSHAKAIGCTIEGLPAGSEIDFEKLQLFLDERAPGKNKFSTARKETDIPDFICGFKGNVSCGTPITAVIKNSDQHSSDYSELQFKPRPGHADYPAAVKYNGFQDFSGGGHFSGRLTAPMCVAGGIALQMLEKEGIEITTRAVSIGGETDSEKMLEAITKAREAGDSVGGIIECVVTGLPVGLGEHMFGSMEGRISSVIWGIPAIKGIEFGDGFGAANLKGSENNDPYIIEDGKIKTATNHCGGILGGMTNGMPLVFRVAIKPTPSIAMEQDTVDLQTMEPVKLVIKGRHDPCIVLRANPCVKAAAAIAVYDALLESK